MMTAIEESRLLSAIAQGDEEALHEFYALYRPRLRRYLWHQLGGEDGIVEEVLQDVVLAVWHKAGTFRGEAKVATWVFQIAHYLALDARHKRDRSSQPTTQPSHVVEDEDIPSQAYESISHEDSVLDRMALSDAIRSLTPKHRAVLHLMAQQGFSQEETAQILGIPIGTVKSRLSYARRALLVALRAHAEEGASDH